MPQVTHHAACDHLVMIVASTLGHCIRTPKSEYGRRLGALAGGPQRFPTRRPGSHGRISLAGYIPQALRLPSHLPPSGRSEMLVMGPGSSRCACSARYNPHRPARGPLLRRRRPGLWFPIRSRPQMVIAALARDERAGRDPCGLTGSLVVWLSPA